MRRARQITTECHVCAFAARQLRSDCQVPGQLRSTRFAAILGMQSEPTAGGTGRFCLST